MRALHFTGWTQSKKIAVDHGYFARVGYILLRTSHVVTGWGIGHQLTQLTRGRPRAWLFSDQARKSTPKAQDLRVILGCLATATATLLVTLYPSGTGFSLGMALLIWHLLGILIYHLKVLIFDVFETNLDVRVWSFRRIFLQAVINVAETVAIFAALYASSESLNFGRALFWSIEGLTLNVPYEWQAQGIQVGQTLAKREMTWICQAITTIIFVGIILGQIMSSMFKREEIAADPEVRVSGPIETSDSTDHT